MRALAVFVDGAALPDEEARAFWGRFSAWMEEHRGDLAGFAASEGLTSVFPGVEDGRAVLRGSRTQPQRPYGGTSGAAAIARDPHPKEKRSGGSGKRHTGRSDAQDRARGSTKGGRNPRR